MIKIELNITEKQVMNFLPKISYFLQQVFFGIKEVIKDDEFMDKFRKIADPYKRVPPPTYPDIGKDMEVDDGFED